MGIFSRLSDIINSNVNTILDRAEDPQKIIRLIIQEMEETLVEVRATAARTIAEKKEIERTLQRYRSAQEDWARKAALALEKGREDLSRAALVEKRKLAGEAQHLEDDLAELGAALERGADDIAKLNAKLQEAKARQKSMQARQETATSRLKIRRQLNDGRVDDAFTRFEHVERRLDRTEGLVEAFDMGRPKSLSEEINELATESEIEDELTALKARLAARSPATGEH
jgi:phage shock protein A